MSTKAIIDKLYYGKRTKNSDYTISQNDDLIFADGSFTLTLPFASTFNSELTIINVGTGNVLVKARGADKIGYDNTVMLSTKYNHLNLLSDQTNVQISKNSCSLYKVTIPESEVSKRGLKNGIKLLYKDTTSIYITGGCMHMTDGTTEKICMIPQLLTVSSPGVAANRQYGVYVTLPDTTNIDATNITITDITSVPPQYYTNSLGWYQPSMGGPINKRLIGLFLTDASAQITEFLLDGNIYRQKAPINIIAGSDGNVNTTLDGTATGVPWGNIMCMQKWELGLYTATNAAVSMRLSTCGDGYGIWGYVDAGVGSRRVVIADVYVKCDSNRKVSASGDSRCTTALDLLGFILPDGI